MKKQVKLLSLAMAAVMSLMLFAGCGGDSTGTSSTAGTSSKPATVPSINAPITSTVSIPAPPVVSTAEPITLLEKGSEFKCKVMTTEEFNTFIADTPAWKDKDYDVSAWTAANAPLGDRVGSSPIGWTGNGAEPHGLLAVTTFEIESLDALKDRVFTMDIFYDNTIYMYLNGTLVFSHDAGNLSQAEQKGNDWVDNYTKLDFNVDISDILVEGTNTLSVSLLDGWGGRELDLAIIAE